MFQICKLLAIEEILLKARYVYIGLDSGSGETFNLLKGGQNDYFDKILGNIKRMVVLRAERNSSIKIDVGFILQQENYKEILGSVKQLKEYWARFRFHHYYFPGDKIKHD